MNMLSTAPMISKNRVIFIGLFTLLAACSLLLILILRSESQQPNTTVTVIEGEDLRADDSRDAGLTRAQLGDTATAWSQSKVVIFDIRPQADYEKSHLEGALSVPVAWLDRSTIAQDARVVIYSQNQTEIDQAVTILKSKGVAQVEILNSSLEELRDQAFIVYGLEPLPNE